MDPITRKIGVHKLTKPFVISESGESDEPCAKVEESKRSIVGYGVEKSNG